MNTYCLAECGQLLKIVDAGPELPLSAGWSRVEGLGPFEDWNRAFSAGERYASENGLRFLNMEWRVSPPSNAIEPIEPDDDSDDTVDDV